MDKRLKEVSDRIISALENLSRFDGFAPKIYIGKTDDFNFTRGRHKDEGLPILLRLADGSPEDIATLEDCLIKWNKATNGERCLNQKEGSAGNIEADKLYACLDSSLPSDKLYDCDETILLGKNFPLNIKQN